MKFPLLLIVCLTVTLSMVAQTGSIQYHVSGKVAEKTSGKGVPYATVMMENDSFNVKKMQACDGSGHFSIILTSPEKYLLTVSAVGYKEFSLVVEVTGQKTDLGSLLIEEGIEIKEVVITAQKPLVKIEVDKIIYSMASDPEAQTNNALEMLRKVPLIMVDAEENITLNGQSNFKVLMNGKSSSMMSSNLKEVLKSLPASTIKDIEVITNPSTKYDAEGIGGIINIITTKKTMNGYNGSASAGVDSRGSYNWSAFLAAKIHKFSFSARYYANQFKQPESVSTGTSEYFNNTDFHYSNSNGNYSYTGLSNGFSGEASYDIDSLNLISLSFWGYQGSYKATSLTETQYLNTGDDITRMYTSSANSKNSYGSLSGNIDYQRTYKKPDKSLTFSYKLDNNPNTVKNNTGISGLVNYPSYIQRSENEAIGREQTLQADYYDPLTKMHQIEGGIKFILRQNTSKSETYREDILEPDYNNDLDYDQYILGAYAGYVFKWEKFSTKAGFRLERTWNDGVSVISGTDTKFKNRLLNLIPYVSFSFMPKSGQTIKLSYTQRLSRPGIWYLNPYVNNTDSMNISYGNPMLEAEVSHSFEMGYTYFKPKFNFSATSYASFVNNSIERISEIQQSGASLSTYRNIGSNQQFGLNLYLNYRPSGKFNVYFNGGGGYSKLEANTGYSITNKGFSYRAMFGEKWTLWKNGSVSINIGMFSPEIMLQGKYSAYYYTSFGVSQYLLKRKFMVTLSASDPFWYKKKYTYERKDITFLSRYEYSHLAQTVRFNVTYNFGQMDLQVKKARRSIQNDDLKSGGSSQGETGAGQ